MKASHRSTSVVARRAKRKARRVMPSELETALGLAPGNPDDPGVYIPGHQETPVGLQSLLLELPPGCDIQELGLKPRPKDMAVREWLLIPEHIDALLSYVGQGVSQPALATVIGVSTFQLAAVLRHDHLKYEAALAALAHVQSAQLQEDLNNVRKGLLDPESARVLASGAQWFLARHDKKIYGDSTRHELTNPPGETLKVEVDHAAADKLVAKLLPPLMLEKSPEPGAS